MGRKNAAEKRQEELRENILADLMDQLDRNGTNGKYYTDLVSDYMKLWDTKNLLILDIEGRGVTVESVTAAGVNLKKNDSVDQLIKLNAQMLKLLDSLGINPSQSEGDADDEM